MDVKLKNKIISSLRKLSYTHKPRTEALNKQKVDSATFECENCGVYIYKGSSEKNYISIKNKYHEKKVIKEKPNLDHITPIIDVKNGWTTWDSFIERMFCEAGEFQVLCKECHDKKTKQENEERRKWKKVKNE